MSPGATRCPSRPVSGRSSRANVGLYTIKAMFDASLAVLDDKALPRPRLAETLPQLNTDSWRLLPEGRMETTWGLKPNLAWHDGMPLTADDFVFGWNLYRTAE